MIYKRGAVYWYKFRWTVKRQQVLAKTIGFGSQLELAI